MMYSLRKDSIPVVEEKDEDKGDCGESGKLNTSADLRKNTS